MDWDGARHSGSMALSMVYPERFRLEVYGPFGETALFVEKNGERFLFKSGNDEIRDQREFEARFGLKIATVMNDLSLRPPVEQGDLTFSTDVREGGDSMCWQGAPGRICMRFLEVNFSPP
jgi:hypothetical protein